MVRHPGLVTKRPARMAAARLDPFTVERRLAQLEREARLEQDLAELKRKVRTSTRRPSTDLTLSP
jgi:hypothetical protein